MTIAAGFKCSTGVVLSADTEESAEDLKWSVEKLSIYNEEWCQAGFSGAGFGDLVDMIIQRIKQELDRGYDNIKDVQECIQSTLLAVYKNEISLHPYSEEDKIVHLLIAIHPKSEQEVTLLKAHATILREVSTYEIIGSGEVIRYVAENLYKSDLPMSQCVLLSIHLVNLAKKYVGGVGGNTNILSITSDGRVGIERIEDSKKQEQFFEQFNEALKDIFLFSPDTSIPNEQLDEKLELFIQTIKELRKGYFDDMMFTDLRRALTEPNSNKGHVYQRFPLGATTERGISEPTYITINLDEEDNEPEK